MKKNKFLLVLLPALALSACKDTPSTSSSTSKPTFDATLLQKLADGYSLDILVEETVENTTSYFYTEAFHDKESYTVKTYQPASNNPSKEVLKLFETYTADDEGYVSSERRNINNGKNYIIVYNPVLEYTKFADYYTNFFSLLTVDDFTESNGVYTLKESSVAKVSSYVITQLYGNPGFELANLEISYDKDYWTLNAQPEPFVSSPSKTYTYNFTCKVLDMGSNLEFEKRADPYPEVTDEVFSNMITALKNNNYTLTQKDYEGTQLTNTSTLIVNGDLTYRENVYDGQTYNVAAYKDGDKYFEANKENGEFIKAREITEVEFKALFPRFNLSASVFDKDGSIYTLKDDVSGDTFAYSIFDALVNEIATLTIEVTDTSYVFTNTNKTNKTVVEFSSVGSSDVGYTIADVKDPQAAKSWADLLDEYSLSHFTSVVGEEGLTTFPVPTNFDLEGWVDFSEEEGTSMLLYLSSTPEVTEETLSSYGAQLVEAGFEDTGEIDEYTYNAKIYANESLMVEVAMIPAGELGNEINFPVLAIFVIDVNYL